jgi:NADH dehydrogenase
VELAGTMAEIARHTLRREFRRIDPRDARVLLIEAGPRVLPAFTSLSSERAQRQLTALGVTVHTGSAVTQVDAAGLQLGDERIAARTVLWAAGIRASRLGALLGAPLDRAGRVRVEPDLSVPGHPEIFVAGDLASLTIDGVPVPGLAPAAKQMGHHVARALRTRLVGQSAASFRYRHFGSLATIGRLSAVVEMWGLRLSGAGAWLLWLWAHIFFLIGFRNRLVVLLDWAWAYFTYQRSARIVISDRI